jgi:integrase
MLPTLERVFNIKTFLGDKLKHAIEPRVTYKIVTAIVSDFDHIIRFYENDILSNTNELLLSLTNRPYAKRGENVVEVLTWQVEQKRYFVAQPGIETVEGKWDRAILAVLLDCALRRSELTALESRHIQQRDGRWVFIDLVGKGKSVRTVPIPPFVKVAIDP